MKEKLSKIIEHYGVMPQLKYFQSEVFELNEAIICEEISKRDDEANNYKSIKDIAEEIADVTVMLLQFKEYYHIDDKDILEIMNKKIERQLERMKNE